MSAFSITFLILIPYCVPAYLMISDVNTHPCSIRIGACMLIHLFGLYVNHGSDLQKYYTLKYKKGELITTGFFKLTRNPNYIGMMCIYTSFITLTNKPLGYILIMAIWTTIFIPRMLMKDVSLGKIYFKIYIFHHNTHLATKKGWHKYREQSWMLFPRIFKKEYENILFGKLLIECMNHY